MSAWSFSNFASKRKHMTYLQMCMFGAVNPSVRLSGPDRTGSDRLCCTVRLCRTCLGHLNSWSSDLFFSDLFFSDHAMLSKRWRTLQCPVPPPRPNVHLQELNCGMFRAGPGWDAPHYVSSDDEERVVAADQEDDERQGDEHQADQHDERQGDERQKRNRDEHQGDEHQGDDAPSASECPGHEGRVMMPHFARVGPDFTRRGMEKLQLGILQRQKKRWEERQNELASNKAVRKKKSCSAAKIGVKRKTCSAAK